jgi:nucleoside-diphosphate-sugar epimerase
VTTQQEVAAALAPAVVESLAPLRGERVVITGGTGFIGTWLTATLCHLNDHHGFQTRIDLMARNARAGYPERPDVTFHERDVRDVAELPADTRFIVHAAGTPDNRIHSSDPVRTIQTFVHGTEAMLWAASRLESIQRVLHVSSGLVYGPQPLDVPALEEGFRGATDFAGVLATYPQAKRAAETICAAYRSQHRLPVVTARPFAFIGPHQALSAPWAVNNFLQDSLHGGPIRILGSGDTVRSYMYPTDMAVWLLAALVRGRVGGAYNIGSSQPVTLRELAGRVAACFRGDVEVVEGGRGQRPTEPSRFVPDTRLAREELGLSETVGLDEAIARTVAWHRAGASTAPAPRLRAVDTA